MKKIFPVIQLIMIGIVTAIVCMLLLCFSSTIPQEAIREHSIESAKFYENHDLFPMLVEDCLFLKQDNYADCITNNMIYHMDSTHPFVSTLRSAYYQPEMMNVNEAFYEAVHEEQTPNINYFRYWHGSMLLVRPLLTVMDINGVRLTLGLLAIALAIVASILLIRQKEIVLAVAYLTGLLLVNVGMICFCIEYVTPFLVLSGGLIFLLLYWKRWSRINAEGLPGVAKIFLVYGILTAFFDFLTTETITFTVPMAILLILLAHKNRLASWQQGIQYIIRNGVAWLCGYAGMFLLKWLLCAVIFGKNAFIESVQMAALRIGGEVTMDGTNLGQTASFSQRLFGVLIRNTAGLFQLKDGAGYGVVMGSVLIVGILILAIVYLFHMKPIPMQLYGPLALLAMMPYARFLCLSNHAFIHYFFAYRAQLVTVMILICFVWENGGVGILHMFADKKHVKSNSKTKANTKKKK